MYIQVVVTCVASCLQRAKHPQNINQKLPTCIHLNYPSVAISNHIAIRCLASHSPPGCDVLMVTTAALQAWLPFVCSASCAIEVINAIIRYSGRVYVCTSIVTHAWLSLQRKRAETQNVGGRLTRTWFRWVLLWQVVAHVHLLLL